MYNSQANRGDLEKSLQRLKKVDLIALLGRAFDELSESKRAPVFGDLLESSSTNGKKKVRVSAQALLKQIVDFHVASLEERYREDFAVNSKNYRDESEGTAKWRRETNRLFDRVITASKSGGAQAVCYAFELLFDLLLRLDDGEDFIFFADEGGSWQIMSDYEKIFPAYFSCLAKVTQPEDYARKACSVIASLAEHADKKHLESARKAASSEQHKAIRAYLKDKPKRWNARRWLKDALSQKTPMRDAGDGNDDGES